MEIENIWTAYRNKLKAFLHSKVSNPSDVDDLLQEILIKTYKNLHTIKSEEKIKSWLFQLARHSIIDFYRKTGKHRNFDSEELWIDESEEDVNQ